MVTGSQQVITKVFDEVSGTLKVSLPAGIAGAGFLNATPSLVAVSSTSVHLLALNAARKYFHFINNSTDTVWVQYGAPAVVGRGIKLVQGSMLQASGSELFLGQINAISPTPNNIDVLEGW